MIFSFSLGFDVVWSWVSSDTFPPSALFIASLYASEHVPIAFHSGQEGIDHDSMMGFVESSLRRGLEASSEMCFGGCKRFRVSGRGRGVGLRNKGRLVGASVTAGIKGVLPDWAEVVDDTCDTFIDVSVHVSGAGIVVGVHLSACLLSRRACSAKGVPKPPVRSTISCALAMLAGVSPGDLVLDPMCGSGSILDEVATWLPTAMLVGIDLAPSPRLPRRMLWQGIKGDGRVIPLRRGTVDKVGVAQINYLSLGLAPLVLCTCMSGSKIQGSILNPKHQILIPKSTPGDL